MGKAVILKGKEQENVYPVTSSDLVYGPITKKTIKTDLSNKVEEAPKDDKQYARINGAWGEVEAGAVSETALITLTPALSELNGVSVVVTTSEGETVLDTTWNGATLSCQVRAGLQYTVAVGAKDGFIAPESVTYTAERGVTRTINMAYVESRLTVGILSNQENDTTIAAVKATVTYGSTSVQVANGGVVNLPQNVSVTITFPAVDGYKAPDAITYTHTGGNVTKNGTYQTELVRVTLSASNGASVSGQKVTINGTAITYGSTTVEKKVPFGTTYSVSADAMDGFTTPASQSFTAAQSVRNLALVYEYNPYGVFIQGVSGKLYPIDSWENQETVNGVAVKTEWLSFVMSTTMYLKALYVENTKEPPLIAHGDITTALTDTMGELNTSELIPVYGESDDLAASFCKNYIFPNNRQGYLGSAGEWKAVSDNLDEVLRAYSKISKTFYTNYYIWTSTYVRYYNGVKFCVFAANTNNFDENFISNQNVTVPFTTL